MRVDVRDGKPFDNTVGRPLRLSGVVVAGRPRAAVPPHEPPAERDGAGRRRRRRPAPAASSLREEWPTGWVMSETADGVPRTTATRFIWESQRNGWNNFYLYDLSGRPDRAAHDVQRHSRRRPWSRWTSAPACSSTPRATATTSSSCSSIASGSMAETIGGSPIRRSTTRSAAASPGSARGRSSRRSTAPCGDLAGQPLFRRHLPDPRHAAGDAARRRQQRAHRRRGRRERRRAARRRSA